jgi:predicted PurR-regulated permease PerM
MDKQLKNTLTGITFGVCLFVVLMNWGAVWRTLGRGAALLRPVWIGCLLAFVLNVPMGKIEKALGKAFSRRKKPVKKTLIRGLSLLLTVILLVGLAVLVLSMLVPQLILSVQEMERQLSGSLPRLTAYLNNRGLSLQWLTKIQDLLTGNGLKTLGSSISAIFGSVAGAVSSATGMVLDFLLGTILAVYLLSSKETVRHQLTRLLRAFLPQRFANRFFSVGGVLWRTYQSYLGGQCVEAVILGCLMLAGFMIFRLPYAGLIAVLTALLSFIPYFGSFITCALGAILIFLISPTQALISIIVYQVVQFCENQFIYPHVVGGAVGLPALWTFLAVLLGGKFFGVWGMILFIPLAASIYTLLGRQVKGRLGAEPVPAQTPAPPEQNT